MRTTSTRASSGTSHLRALRFEGGRRLAQAVVLPLLLAFAIAAKAASAPELRAGVFDPPRGAPDFALRGSNGAELKMSTYRGKVVALAFGYTHCPGVCPATLAYLAEARKKLSAAAANFQVIYVTVDPERDSAEQLKTFLTGFDPTFIGGTGTPEQLAGVRKAYGIALSDKIFVESQPKSTYFFDHSSFIYLIDRSGMLRAMMPFGMTADDIAHDAKALLAQ